MKSVFITSFEFYKSEKKDPNGFIIFALSFRIIL